MGGATTATGPQAVAHHQSFHPLRVGRVVHETADSRSFVLDVPGHLRTVFSYEAGQFCNLRVTIDGERHIRCYSMSSSPEVDDELQVTVKRVEGGLVSNWMIDTMAPGDLVEASPPAGFFRIGSGDGEVVAFGAGSGVTPIFSLLKTTLATTSRRFRLLYANHDRDAAIFAGALDELASRHRDRFGLVHHFDVDEGFVCADSIRAFADVGPDAEFYVCGPAPFMDLVEREVHEAGFGADRIHIERFTPRDTSVAAQAQASPPAEAHVTIELDGRSAAIDHRRGTTVLQSARQAGMSPPYSCESGSCATCMARLVEGEVSMLVNNALTEEEVEEGWILTCQSVPTTSSVRVVYG
jgi:3-ketosteroid 9alpha-monooxygenase subunit B